MKKILISLTILCAMACNKKTADLNQSTDSAQKPNIIYIMADDLTTQAISAYGDIYKDIAPTPNIDRLAKEGMLFQNVLCTNAICGPSRAAILTGKHSNLNGYYKNEHGGVFDNNQWTFPEEFQKNGYTTSLFGKWHLGSEPRGFDKYMYHVSSGQQGLYWNPEYNINGTRHKVKGYDTNITTDSAMVWLQHNANKKPFLMLLQYKAPHRPWEPDKKYDNLWADKDMPYPSTFNDDYKGREKTAGNTEMTMDFFSRRDMKMTTPKELTGKEKLKWEFYGAAKGEIVQPDDMSAEEGRKWRYQRYIKDYLACVKSVDDNIGRVLDYLDKEGLAQNTIVILTSDQGFYLGDHGFFDKRFIYEESLRMPFLMRYPAKIKAGSENKDIISNIDFAPTLLDVADIKYNEVLQGKSFASIIKGRSLDNWRQSMYYHYYEYPFWHHVQPHYGIRNERYTLAHFYHDIDVWEFYDNINDPDQMHNAINDPKYQNEIKKLKIELSALQKQYKNNKSLAEFRSITDKDFGHITNENDEKLDQLIQKKE